MKASHLNADVYPTPLPLFVLNIFHATQSYCNESIIVRKLTAFGLQIPYWRSVEAYLLYVVVF
jgi:hypothetical protein